MMGVAIADPLLSEQVSSVALIEVAIFAACRLPKRPRLNVSGQKPKPR